MLSRLLRACLALILLAGQVLPAAADIAPNPLKRVSARIVVPTATSGVTTMLPVGATVTVVGDGLQDISAGVGSGAPNAAHRFMLLMGGRLQPTALPVLALSGTRIKTSNGSQYAWIYPYAIDAAAAQTPDVMILGTMGRNDLVLSTDLGSNPVSGSTISAPMQDWYDAVQYAYSKFTAYAGAYGTGPPHLFIVTGTVASTLATESAVESGQSVDRRTRSWAAQAAFVAALTASDPRVRFVDVSGMLPMTSYSSDSATSYIHIDNRGALYVASGWKAAIDADVESKTPDQVVDMVMAGTYPLMSGSQLDADTALAGTAGTITGPGVTGSIATTKLVTNTTGATGVTVSQVSTSGGRTKTVVDFTSATTSSSDGRLLIQDKSNLSISATPGSAIMSGALMRTTAAPWNFGADLGGNAYGRFAAGGSSLGGPTAPGASSGAASAEAMASFDTLVMAAPLPAYSNSTTITAKRSWSLWWKSGTALAGTYEIDRPFTYRLSERTRHKPTYLGDVQNAGGGRVASGTPTVGTALASAMRPSGTVSAATGGTVRVEPGLWTPRGLTETDFAARRIYDCVSVSVTIGSCTLLTTLSASTWTYAVPAGTVAAGHLIYVEVDADNGIGGTVTARGLATITVGS